MATATQVAFSPHVVAETLGTLPHVVKIFVAQDAWTVHVWTIVKSFERNVRDKIYSAERTIFSHFPGYKFDFNVVEGDEKTTIAEAKLVFSAQ